MGFQFLVQRTAGNIQPLGGTFHMTSLFAEDTVDVMAFEFFQGHVGCVFPGAGVGAECEIQIHDFDDGILGLQQGALQDIAKLANIAWPGMSLQHRQGILG